MLRSSLARLLCPRRRTLQKLFSAFPDGWPGIGLILLRLAVALSATIEGLSALARSGDPAIAWWAGVLSAMVALALLLGFLTPIAGTMAAMGCIAMGGWLLLHGGAGMHSSAIEAFEPAAMSIALVFLGPGAYSIDARLFGRREIIIPEGHRSSH